MTITESLMIIGLVTVWLALIRVDLWSKPDFWRKVWAELVLDWKCSPRTISGMLEFASGLLALLLMFGMIATPLYVCYMYILEFLK